MLKATRKLIKNENDSKQFLIKKKNNNIDSFFQVI